jgi:chromosome segregation ATPase
MTKVGLVRAKTPEEIEIEEKLLEIEQKRQCVALLGQEIEELKQALGRFQVEYNARVGRLYVELDKLELLIQEYRLRIRLIVDERKARLQEIEDEVKQRFSARWQETRQTERETSGASEAYERQKAEPKLDEETAQELKRLYRELAKRFHPDLAETDEERRENSKLMAEINEAYARKDLDKLREIAEREGERLRSVPGETLAEKLARLTQESHRLGDVIQRLRGELEELKRSPTWEMMQKVEKGRESGQDILAELTENLEEQIRRKREELGGLVQRYADLVSQ